MSTGGRASDVLEALGREARARFGNGRDAGTRVYRGRSVDELVPQIQRDLGAEAIILRRREGLTGGVLGFFQHPYVEIEAMPGAPGVDVYDEPESAPAAPEPASPPPPAAPPLPPLPAGAPAPPLAARRAAQQYQPAPAPPPAPAPLPPASQPAPTPRRAPSPPAAQPTFQRRPTFEYRSGSMRQPEPPTPPPATAAPPFPAPPAPAPTPSPFYARGASGTRGAPPPAAATGSAYVTAHLAALARADRARVPPRAATPPRRDEEAGWTPASSAAIPPRREDEPGWSPAFEELLAGGVREERPPPPRARPTAPRRAISERRVVAPGSQSRARAGVARSLQRCGISEELAEELIDGASAHALALAPRSGLAQAVRATLAQRIPVAPPLPAKGAAIVVVGAGGAGKTTCCAALLGAYRKSSSLPASYATLTREGERGELRMVLSPYLMKASSASAPRALRALRRARGDGIAVIDTPSLSPSDRAGVRELAHLLGELAPERVVVALPATLGATAAAQLLQALRPLGANALAVTHADETDQIGVAVEAACRFGLAPELMLDRVRGGGWRVRQVSPTDLAEKLLP